MLSYIFAYQTRPFIKIIDFNLTFDNNLSFGTPQVGSTIDVASILRINSPRPMKNFQIFITYDILHLV